MPNEMLDKYNARLKEATDRHAKDLGEHLENLAETERRCVNCGHRIGAFKYCPSGFAHFACVEPARVNLEALTTISEFVSAAYMDACDRGWHDKPREIPEVTNLFHEEAAEMFREYREGRGPTETYHEGAKPCGFPTELADLVIRAFDAAGEFGIDLHAAIVDKMKYNRTRPYRHGGKVC